MEFGYQGLGGHFRCVVDTGSSNLAISADSSDNAGSHFRNTQTTERETESFRVSYVASSWEAQRVRDVVSFVVDPFIAEDTEFGAIISSTDFFPENSNYDGILGMAFASIARPKSDPIEPFLDSLVRTKNFRNLFALKMCVQLPGPQNAVPYASYGSMTLGTADIGLVFPDLHFTHIQDNSYYSVIVTRLAVGGEAIDVNCNVYNSPFYSIVDSGTTDVIVPLIAHEAIVAKIDAVLDVPADLRDNFYTGRSCLFMDATTLYTGLPDFTISLLSSTNTSEHFHLRVPAYRYMRYAIDEDGNECYIFSIIPIDGETGITIGITALSGFVVSFDRDRTRIGFATSSCAGYGHQHDLTPIPPQGPIGFDASLCLPSPLQKEDISSMWVFVTIGIGAIILVALGVLVTKNILKWRHREIRDPTILMPDIPGVNVNVSDDDKGVRYHPRDSSDNRTDTCGRGHGRVFVWAEDDGVDDKETGKEGGRSTVTAATASINNSDHTDPSDVTDTPDHTLVVSNHTGEVNFDYGMSDA
eukprot:m.119190 g.119190  ORF g.119190 m.119190 type:complete len:528 (+) comp12905_c0_seq2:273-1856(+)